MKNSRTTSSTGSLGEQIALQHLLNKGYTLIQKNYWKKWGEIDLILDKSGVIHFVEVKSVSYETKEELLHAVTHETWRPEEQVHSAKLKKLGRTVETWLIEQKEEFEWQLDVAAVRMVPRETYASVNILENIELE